MKNFRKQNFLMTVGGLFVCLLGLVGVSSCEKDENSIITSEKKIDIDLVCKCVIPEVLSSYHNCYVPYEIDTIWADLALDVNQKVLDGSNVGDSELEERILQNIDPHNLRGGELGTTIFYTMKTCKSIKISLYDKDSVFVADVTDKARFYYFMSKNDDFYQMLINSDKVVLGQVRMGMTIKEYLECNPFLFVFAHFIFDGLNKSDIADGKYFRTEILLEDGTILVDDSEEPRAF